MRLADDVDCVSEPLEECNCLEGRIFRLVKTGALGVTTLIHVDKQVYSFIRRVMFGTI